MVNNKYNIWVTFNNLSFYAYFNPVERELKHYNCLDCACPASLTLGVDYFLEVL
jgi:hypothetical protein